MIEIGVFVAGFALGLSIGSVLTYSLIRISLRQWAVEEIDKAVDEAKRLHDTQETTDSKVAKRRRTMWE